MDLHKDKGQDLYLTINYGNQILLLGIPTRAVW